MNVMSGGQAGVHAPTDRPGAVAQPGWFSRLMLPAAVFLSVLTGGGYASGREIVEYGAKFGAYGVWSIVAIFVGFTVISAIAYEFARVFHAYDYRTYMRNLIGPAWILFDVLFIVMAVLVIAIVTSAAEEIVATTVRIPSLVALLVVIGIVGLIMFWGRRFLEAFKSVGSLLLYVGFIAFAAMVLAGRWEAVQAVFARGDTSYVPGATVGAAVFSGLLYVGYNLVVVPGVLFVLDNLRSPKDSAGAGVLTGLVSTVPFILTYLAVMAFYPSRDVLDAPVPWLAMLEQVGGAGLGWVYTLVVFYTLVDTSTGMIHAILNRLDSALQEYGRQELGGRHRSAIAVAILIASVLLSRFGIIALVAQGYTAMAYGFLLLLALPLVTVGLYKIAKARSQRGEVTA